MTLSSKKREEMETIGDIGKEDRKEYGNSNIEKKMFCLQKVWAYYLLL